MSLVVDHTSPVDPAPVRSGTPAPPARAAGPRGALGPYLRTARPRQWLKNGLVLAAPAAAGVLLRPATALEALLAFVSFTLAAVATYFVNDALDATADRQHPRKSLRPVAAGLIGERTAFVVGALCAAAALAVAVPLGWTFGAVVAAYLALTALYSARLKRLAVLDILAVASGFLLRAAAGSAATGVPMSNWFLLVALFGSLFLVTAKRAAEQGHSEAGAPHVRATLDAYPAAWLQQVMTLALTGTVLSYALWAFQYTGTDTAQPLITASLLPFLATLLRYSLLVAQGHGEEPERLVTSDRFLLGAGAAWALLVGAGIYLG